ncbi:AAA family ATPase [Photobacterium sp. 1_MG-2023]|uniref:AAA family ATPase n=1 Tax=Photobacterium sp. 1_MG-2023 TaxID=3062646 RepID=UPI0026E2FA9C|nr:AAA family ATPase [Photobacterium sp. 1_MG-2023]MDO6706175.1 AAA family ATPase [Photobacterium sp. 1_MG-2023]
MTIQSLKADTLYRASVLTGLDTEYSSTKGLEPLDEIVGQERAQLAVEFAMSMKEKGYHIHPA